MHLRKSCAISGNMTLRAVSQVASIVACKIEEGLSSCLQVVAWIPDMRLAGSGQPLVVARAASLEPEQLERKEQRRFLAESQDQVMDRIGQETLCSQRS